jgi:cytochrome P450
MTDVSVIPDVHGVSGQPEHVPDHLVVDFDLYEERTGLFPVQDWWLELRASNNSPIVWTPRNGGHWVALRGALIGEVMSDAERFSSRVNTVPRRDPGESRFLPISLDPPEHGRYRAILNPVVTPRAVRDQENRIRVLIADLIDGFREVGSCELMAEFAKQVPAAVILGMADLPVADAPLLITIVDELVRQKDPIEVLAATEAFVNYFRPVIEARRGHPGTDVISAIVNGKIDGVPISDEDGLGLVIQFVGAGLDTTAALLGFAIFYLARNPEQRQLLLDNPSLIARASAEMVRRFPLATVGRVVQYDLDFCGVQLKQDDIVIAPTPLLNFDEALFPDPLNVDFERPPIRHHTFGQGQHHCPGDNLARAEFRIALEEWLKRIPQFELDTEAVTFKNGIVATLHALPLRWRV